MTLTPITERFAIGNLNGGDLLIGQGGMGTVYHGVDRANNAPVAIKLLKSDFNDPQMLQRFMREGEVLSQLNHPNIVKLLDAVQVKDQHYLVMEYVSGGSLRDILQKTPRLSVQRALYIALDLADALTRAHRLGILHRDIKPDNVLVAEDGTPRLTDFGMAQVNGTPHITQDGAIVGTLAYIAPEIFTGEQADERTDIWAFGMMLYEMLAGERPFHYDQPGALINAILTQKVFQLESLRPDVPIALVDLIYRMLVKDRQGRLPSVRLIGAELEALLRGDVASYMPAPVAQLDSRFDSTSTPSNIRASQRLAPNNLPMQPTMFVGREAELKELSEMLANPATRLVTVQGAGGIGKTRLSLALGVEQLSKWRDGVFFVSLVALTDPQDIVRAIADAVNFAIDRNDTTTLFNYFAGKHILLLLDNFEHLTSGANLVADLLQHAPELKIVVTSRERLRLRGENPYELNTMKIPAARENTLDKVKSYPSAMLFVQSARRVLPEFELTNENAGEVARILRLVEGLPLGIELAAAWLEALPLDDIAIEIEKSIDFLETDLRDVPDRHRSMRAVFEYSWNLMSQTERDIFMRLAIFRNGFERDAAEKVTGASLRTLTNFVNKSLLQRDTMGRYYMPKLLRQYVDDRFTDPKARDEAHEMHAEYYGSYIAALAPALNSDRESAAMDAIEAEYDNLRLAWDSAIMSEQQFYLDEVLDTLVVYYANRGMSREGVEMFATLAESLIRCKQADTPLYWRAINRQMWLLARLGNYEEAREACQKAYAFFTQKKHEDAKEAALALNQLSYTAMMQGNMGESIRYAQESVELMGDLKDVTTWFMGMGNWGYAEFLAGNLQQARMIYESIQHTFERVDYSPSGKAYMQNNLGEILRTLGEIREAEALFRQAYNTFKSEKNLRGQAFTIGNIAGILFTGMRIQEAEEMYRESYRLNKEIGDRYGLGHSLSALGNSATMVGNETAARQYFEQSLAIRKEIGDQRGIADSYGDLARVYLKLGDYKNALLMVDESIKLQRETKDLLGMAFSLAGKATAFIMAGRYDEAEKLTEETKSIGEELEYTLVVAYASLLEGQLAYKKYKDLDKAERFLKQAIKMGENSQFFGITAVGLVSYAELETLRGNTERALYIISAMQRFNFDFVGDVTGQAKRLLAQLKGILPSELVTKTLTTTMTVDIKDLIDMVLNDA